MRRFKAHAGIGFSFGVLLLGLSALAVAESPEDEITSFPESLDRDCRGGRAKIFDECGDQLLLFKAALARAVQEDKVLLVSFGAEWCIWCHVFDQYIHGGKTSFDYTYGTPDSDARETATLYEREERDVTADAKALRSYVAANFVVLHVDYQYAPNGFAVLDLTGAGRHYDNSVPFIFTVGRDGSYAGKLDPDRVETRRDGLFEWYRGYDRERLKANLAELRSLALAER